MFGKSERAQDYQQTEQPIVAMAKRFPNGFHTAWHSHRRGQLLFAAEGVMLVSTEAEQWTIPATRGVWIPANIRHKNQMFGNVQMRTVYIEPRREWNLPEECTVLTISPLLRELILQAVRIRNDYRAGTRDGRLMRMIIDEISPLAVGSFSLAFPRDKRARRVARGILEHLDSPNTVADWAATVDLSGRTLERIFLKEIGVTVGRWQLDARLQASLPWLAEGRGILEVALALGYASPSAFSAAFRRYFGTAPSAYFRVER